MRRIKGRVIGKPMQSARPISFRKTSRDVVNIIANTMQLAVLSIFGYILFAAIRIDGLSPELLVGWTGVAVLLCGIFNLLELLLLSGILAKILALLEGCAYYLWACSGSIGISIIEPENTQASLFKTVVVLLLLVAWNITQLSWRVSKFRSRRAKESLQQEDLQRTEQSKEGSALIPRPQPMR